MTKPTPPGWYPYMGDSNGNERYWNGTDWENRFRRKGSTTEFTESPRQSRGATRTKSPKSEPPSTASTVIGSIIILAIVGFIAASCIGDDDESTTARSTQETTTPALAPSTGPGTTPPTPPPTAEGFTDEQLFLTTLALTDVPVPNNQLMINVGRAVCSDFDTGVSFASVGLSLVAASDGAYTHQHVGSIIGAAVPAFCPEHRNLIPGG